MMCSLGTRSCFHKVTQLTTNLSMRTTKWIGKLMATTWDTCPLIYMGTIVLCLAIVCWRKHTPLPTSNKLAMSCCNPTLGKVWGWDSYSQKWEATSELNNRRKNTLSWGVLYTVGKVLKCRCPKCPRMSHLDICSPSYGQKKGRESNCQFDSRPLKVENRPLPDVCRGSAMRHWKALEESYNFGLDLTPIEGQSQEIWVFKVSGVQLGTVSGLLLGSPKKKCHSDVAPAE
jgi:hypothetical protein